MKHLPFRSVPAALAAAFCALALAACGGHESHHSSSSGNSSNSVSTAAAPDFDVSGSWTTRMDDVTLGATVFDMSSSGHLSGSAQTDSGEKASINGQLSGSDAEYTMTFHHKTYLVSVQFASSHTSGSGTLVDADGHVHSVTLSR